MLVQGNPLSNVKFGTVNESESVNRSITKLSSISLATFIFLKIFLVSVISGLELIYSSLTCQMSSSQKH